MDVDLSFAIYSTQGASQRYVVVAGSMRFVIRQKDGKFSLEVAYRINFSPQATPAMRQNLKEILKRYKAKTLNDKPEPSEFQRALTKRIKAAPYEYVIVWT